MLLSSDIVACGCWFLEKEEEKKNLGLEITCLEPLLLWFRFLSFVVVVVLEPGVVEVPLLLLLPDKPDAVAKYSRCEACEARSTGNLHW